MNYRYIKLIVTTALGLSTGIIMIIRPEFIDNWLIQIIGGTFLLEGISKSLTIWEKKLKDRLK